MLFSLRFLVNFVVGVLRFWFLPIYEFEAFFFTWEIENVEKEEKGCLICCESLEIMCNML